MTIGKKNALVMLFFATATCFAQDGNSFDGKWLAKFSTPTGDPREGVLQLKGNEGTWQVDARVRNPCIGRQAPVTVVTASATEIELKFHNSKALAGCTDSGAKLKRTGDKTLEGTLEDGRSVSLVRQ